MEGREECVGFGLSRGFVDLEVLFEGVQFFSGFLMLLWCVSFGCFEDVVVLRVF